MNNVCAAKKLKNNFNAKLIEEVENIVEKPNVILGNFEEMYLKKPQEFIKNVYDNWLTKKGVFILGIDHYKENKPTPHSYNRL